MRFARLRGGRAPRDNPKPWRYENLEEINVGIRQRARLAFVRASEGLYMADKKNRPFYYNIEKSAGSERKKRERA